MHANHIDEVFCTTTARYSEGLTSVLGAHEECFSSQDDRCSVLVGLATANSQRPVLMHAENLAGHHDHSWVVAGRHKLILSV
jgi:hypothetical protein